MRGMELQIECGACAAIQLSRTLGARAPDWRAPYHAALEAVAAAFGAAAEPAEMLAALYRSVDASLQDGDFYEAVKDAANACAERWFSAHGPAVADLRRRLLVAAAGNAIDAGVDVEPDVVFGHFEAALDAPLGRDDRAAFFAWLSGRDAPKVLYLLDNAGEAVFDREVMRALAARGAKVTAVVRNAPILNDVTPREADRLGLHEVAAVTDTGRPGYGLVGFMADPAARALIAGADVVIAKGIANLETLSHRPLPVPVLFCFRAKCGPSARAAEAPPGTTVIWWRPSGPAALTRDPPSRNGCARVRGREGKGARRASAFHRVPSRDR